MYSCYWFTVALLCLTCLTAITDAKAQVHLIANQTKLTDPTASPGKPSPAQTTPSTTTTTTTRRTPPPPPPPPKSCDDEGKCTEKNKICNAESKCVCDVRFREITDGSCVEKPKLGDSCFDNVTWLECYGSGLDPNCFSGEGSNKGKCVCSKGHEPKSDKTCAPITKKLGEACTNDAECVLSYSYCNKGQCTCVDGFSASGATCQPKEFRCPSGEPKKEKGQVVVCEVDFDAKTGQIGDNCGASNFCFVPPHSLTNIGKPRGHCCPTPSPPESAKLVCPYGDPLSNGTCVDKKTPGKSGQKSTCPTSSHQCFAVQFRPHEMICCPDPCRQSVSHFDFNGRCFDYVNLGAECELPAQCTGDAECADSGGHKVCQCKKGFHQASANQCEEAA